MPGAGEGGFGGLAELDGDEAGGLAQGLGRANDAGGGADFVWGRGGSRGWGAWVGEGGVAGWVVVMAGSGVGGSILG